MEPDPSLLNELNCFLENAQRMKIEFKHMMEEIDQCINEIKSYNSIEDTKSRMNSLLKRQVHEDAQALQQSTPILELITFPKLTYNQHIPFFYQTSYLYHSKSIVLKSFARARMPGEITFIDCGSFTKTIVIGGDGFLRGFNKENGYCIGEWIVTNPSFRNCVYCAVPHYYHIVFGTDDGFVRFLNTSTFSVEEEFPAHSAPVTKLLSINLNTLLTYSEPIIKLWKKVVNVYECINQIETKLFAPIDVFYIRQENVKFTTTNSMVYTIKDGTYEQDSLIEDHIIPKPPLDYSIRIEEKEVVIEAKKDSIQIPIPSNVTASDCQTDCFGIGCNEDFFFWTINVKIG